MDADIFLPGATVPLVHAFRDDTGALVDPTSPQALIIYPNGTTTATVSLTQIGAHVGQYRASWTVPPLAAQGVYSIIYRGTIDDELVQADAVSFVVDYQPPSSGAIAGLAENALTTLERLKSELGIDSGDTSQDDHLALLINVVSGAIESELNRDLGRATVTELLSGYGRQRLNLRRYPIEEVTSAEVDGVAVTDYKILPGELGQLWRRDGWPLSASRYGDLTLDADPSTADLNVEIEYTGGYVLPAHATSLLPRTLPWAIEGVCLRLCVDMHNRGPGLSSEQSAAGFRYEVGLTLLRDESAKLKRYKRWA